MKRKILKEFRAIIFLAAPMILNLLAFMAMQFVDTVMLGRLGTLALASAALGGVVFIFTLVGCIGVVTAVGTLTAEAFGENNKDKAIMIGQQGVWVVLFVSLFAMIFIWNAHHLLLLIKQPINVVLGAKEFLHGLFWGLLGALGFIHLREFIMATSKPKIVVIVAVAAIPINALLNYWFMYGGLGLPALKIFGIGLGTAVVDWLIFFALAIYVGRHKGPYPLNLLKITLPQWKPIKKILLLGLPVGAAFLIEEFTFLMVALLVGYFGVTSLAAHQIAIQCMFTMVMIQIGISQAATIRVSQLLGAQQQKEAYFATYLAIGLGLIFAFIVTAIVWAAPQFFIGLIINVNDPKNQPVVSLATQLLLIASVFHFIDGAQIITNGALRGYQDTFIPMCLGLFSFWVVGMTSGYFLGFIYHYGAAGLWIGLSLGMLVSAVLSQLRFRWLASN